MSTDTLHKIAEADTPDVVDVPKTLNGLALWFAGRFGIGGVALLMAAYGLHIVYTDMRAQQLTVIQALVASATAQATNTAVLEQIKQELHDAHVRVGGTVYNPAK